MNESVARTPEPVAAYHQVTKHHPRRFARALGYLDWDNQPDPFRRYEGARLLPLDEIEPGSEPAYEDLFVPGRVAPRPLGRASVSQLFYDSLALSAWKELGDARWPLRVNPSSGNLHPTEGYLVAGPVAGLHPRPALFHYAPLLHALELRAELTDEEWTSLAAGFPDGTVFVGLTSIHWREAWKYGERAFRYCQHDVGHALGAVGIAAAALGWTARLLAGVTDPDLATLLGVARQEGVEAEHPDCLLALAPQGEPVAPEHLRDFRPAAALLERLGRTTLAGDPNSLSDDHHDWPIIAEVSAAAERTAPAASAWPVRPDPRSAPAIADGPSAGPARRILRQRRSAVSMDGTTSIDREAFFRMLARVGDRGAPVPFASLPWRPHIHLALFVHRVEGLAPGLYALARGDDRAGPLRACLSPELAWERPSGCPDGLDLFLLRAMDCRAVAAQVSCQQDIAADGAFAVSMLAELEQGLREHGEWFYRPLHWEAGLLGQVLYLEAEAAGVRATGIGCFFDDLVHQVLGITDSRLQTLYHFTVGGPVDDPRLRTAPAYAHRAAALAELGLDDSARSGPAADPDRRRAPH